MIVYRLTKNQYAHDLSGEGARLAGGRWNSKGKAVLYTSSCQSLCLTEMLAYTSSGHPPVNFNMVVLSIPDQIIRQIPLEKLDKSWRVYPHRTSTVEIGDAIYNERRFPVLKVPSAIIPMESNYILFPQHPLFREVEIIDSFPFSIDSRLIS